MFFFYFNNIRYTNLSNGLELNIITMPVILLNKFSDSWVSEWNDKIQWNRILFTDRFVCQPTTFRPGVPTRRPSVTGPARPAPTRARSGSLKHNVCEAKLAGLYTRLLNLRWDQKMKNRRRFCNTIFMIMKNGFCFTVARGSVKQTFFNSVVKFFLCIIFYIY